MSKCIFCQREYEKNMSCEFCGAAQYRAKGFIIYGSTFKDVSNCEATLTDKYILVRKVFKSEYRKKALAQGFGGILGAAMYDAALESKVRTYGYYDLKKIRKCIYPYNTSKLRKNTAIKLINDDDTDFILVFNQPELFEGARKVRDTMMKKIMLVIKEAEDGTGINHGLVYCEKPYVNKDNFDKIPPDHVPEETANEIIEPEAKEKKQTQKTTENQKKPDAEPVAKPAAEPDTELKLAPLVVSLPEAYSKTENDEKTTGIADRKRIICPHCKEMNFLGMKFCGFCGELMEPTDDECEKKKQSQKEIEPQEVKCKKCGKAIREGAKFCKNCGYPTAK